jgi:hypothetical protein
VEERQKRIMGLLVAIIHRGFTVLIDCTLLCLLGLSEGHVSRPLNQCMTLKHLTVVLLLIAGVRGVLPWVRSWRPTRHGRLAGATLLGGPDHILPRLGPLLPTRIHPEIRRVGEKLDNMD